MVLMILSSHAYSVVYSCFEQNDVSKSVSSGSVSVANDHQVNHLLVETSPKVGHL